MRLMIVDDHPGVRKLIRQFVATASDTVCECASGDEAIRKAHDFLPDAVTMDMRMPGTCGLTATRAIRAVHPAARVVIVTSHDQPDLPRAAKEAGAAGLVLKDNLAQLHELLQAPGAPVVPAPEAQPFVSPTAQALLTLMVDNSAADCELIAAELLRCGFKPVIQRVDCAEDLRRALELGNWDLVLTEYDLHGFSGEAALEILRQSKTYVPAICVTGVFIPENVRRILEAGAVACVDKNHPGPLANAIKKALCVPSAPTTPMPAPTQEATVSAAPAADAHSNSLTLSRLLTRVGRLEDENRDLRAFACSIAHDLSAPLRGVGAAMDRLQEARQVGRSADDKLLWQRVADGCRVLSTRVEALLSLARFERCPAQFAFVSLNEVIEDALSEACSDEKRSRIELRIASLPVVWGDRSLLQLAFANLLSNAIKFTAHLPRPVIEIGCAIGGSEATVFIKDNGLGFDMRGASRLFQPFGRLHAGDELPGLGLGLATARRIIQRHHGRLNAESAVNHGATFYCTLPTAAAKEDTGNPPSN